MDYVLQQEVDKNIVYYGVYSTEVEARDGSDILCTARKKYFETGKKQHARSVLKTQLETFRYSLSMENGVPLKFKKIKGTQQVEIVTVLADGYCVKTYDDNHSPVKKTYYDNEHNWKKSEIFINDRSPVYVLFPSLNDDEPVIMRKSRNGKTDTLRAFNISVDKQLTDKLNILTNEPSVFAVTSEGSFYYCTAEEYKERQATLEKLLKVDDEQWQDEDEMPTQQSDFVVNTESVNTKSKKPAAKLDLKNSPEVRIGDKSLAVETEPKKGEDFFAKLEEIARKNNVDIDSVKKTKLDSDVLPPREDKSVKTLEELKQEIHQSIAEAVVQAIDQTESPVKTATEEVIKPTVAEPKKKPAPVEEKKAIAQKKITEEMPTERVEIPTAEQSIHSSEVGEEENCLFADVCPYEHTDKQIIESGGRRYFYFGDLNGTKRNGHGKTVMTNGNTAYDGDYVNDKRDGFGAYYYKSGKLCYAGHWSKNMREGLGVAFSPNSGNAFVGQWHNDKSIHVGASFDRDGKLLYAGNVSDGKRDGAGITYNDDDKTLFVGKYKDGEFLETGTQFSCDGNLLYTGGFKDNMRSGNGTSYYEDSTVKYKGEWLYNKYNGKGILTLEDGSTIKGNFKNGKADGNCTVKNANGSTLYVGGFIDDNYNGSGRIYTEQGGYAEGRFVDGEPTGIFNEYTPDKQLVYCGEWNDMHRNGRGIEYKNGEKRYEGEFENAVYNGQGKLYKDGILVYSGSFQNGQRSGFGVEFKDDEMVYQGQWDNDSYNGCGIEYTDGDVHFIGMFTDGVKDGRINEIIERKVMRRSLYKNGELIYMCEYTRDGSLEYYGGVKDNVRNGMGCSFSSSCEKQFEGIFKNGKHDKAMKVALKELNNIPACKELENTEYELYRVTPQYIIEKNISTGTAVGLYTGRLKDGLPDGSGTILYFDHRYTGVFEQGKAEGKGIIYMNDGGEKRGYFSSKPFVGCETVIMNDVTYYFSGS